MDTLSIATAARQRSSKLARGTRLADLKGGRGESSLMPSRKGEGRSLSRGEKNI